MAAEIIINNFKQDKMRTSFLNTGYNFLRIALGINFLLHGLVRLMTGIDEFAKGMTALFQKTIIPAGLVNLFAYCLPFIELLIGIAVIGRIYTKATYLIMFSLLVILLAGTSVRQDWNTVALQMFYILLVAVITILHDFLNETQQNGSLKNFES